MASSGPLASLGRRSACFRPARSFRSLARVVQHPRFFRSSFTPFQLVLGDFCSVETQTSFLEPIAPLGLGLNDVSPLAPDETEVVDAHEASSRRFLGVSPCCRRGLQRWQTSPDSASAAHRQDAPTRMRQRGSEERDPVDCPAGDMKLFCGERRARRRKGCIHLSVSILWKQSFTAAVATNVVGLAPRESVVSRSCPGPPSKPGRTGRRGDLRCSLDRSASFHDVTLALSRALLYHEQTDRFLLVHREIARYTLLTLTRLLTLPQGTFSPLVPLKPANSERRWSQCNRRHNGKAASLPDARPAICLHILWGDHAVEVERYHDSTTPRRSRTWSLSPQDQDRRQNPMREHWRSPLPRPRPLPDPPVGFGVNVGALWVPLRHCLCPCTSPGLSRCLPPPSPSSTARKAGEISSSTAPPSQKYFAVIQIRLGGVTVRLNDHTCTSRESLDRIEAD